MSSSIELSKLNHHKNLALWQQMVYDCRNSGMTVRAWCEKQGITEKSYYYRQGKVWKATQREGQSRQETTLPTPGTARQSALAAIIPCARPLVPEQQEPVAAPALVLRSDTWTVEVHAGCDQDLLRLVLRTVKQHV